LAAVLACPGAVASHRASAGLWRLLSARAGQDPVDITVPPGSYRGRRPGIRVQRSALAKDESGKLDGIPLTLPARTILDLSHVVTARELERALAQAERERLVQPSDLQLLLNRYPGRAGTRRLRALIERDAPPVHTRSEAEERLLDLIRTSGLPEPEMNVLVEGPRWIASGERRGWLSKSTDTHTTLPSGPSSAITSGTAHSGPLAYGSSA
jgi:hypothetical protein